MALALVGLTACDESVPPAAPYVDAGPPPRVGICTPTSGIVGTTGQYAMLGALQVQVNGKPDTLVAICPDPQVRPSRILARVVTTDDGMGGVVATMNICKFELPTVLGAPLSCPADPSADVEIILSLGQQLAALLPTIDVSFLTGLTPTATVGDSFTSDPITVTLGTDVAPTDPLPAWDTSIAGCSAGSTVDGGTPDVCVDGYANVVDDDGDGLLGVTLAVSASPPGLVSGTASVTLRLTASFDGDVRNANCILGNTHLALDFTIVDSDANAAGLPLTTPLVIENIPPFDFLPTSTVKLLRADSMGLNFDDDHDGTVTCAEILNNEGQFQR